MRRTLPMTLIFFALAGSDAFAAAEPKAAPSTAEAKPSPEAAALKPESVIPKRELVFDESEEERELLFPPVGTAGSRLPEIAQQRYAAFLTLRFEIPTVWDDPAGSDHHAIRQMSSLRNMLVGVSKPRLYYFLAQIPRERLPSGEVLEMITADFGVHVVDVQRAALVGPYGPEVSDFRMRPSPGRETSSRNAQVMACTAILAAPTADRAKQLAQAALSAYDYGFSLPYHQQMVERLTHLESAIVEQRGEAKKLQDELAACQKQLDDLKPWSDITRESLTGLTTQQRMIAVEEAGLKARIAACEKLLRSRPRGALGPFERAEQLETAKTTAEIELVGLSAKRTAIEEIIEKGRKRLDLQAKVIDLNLPQFRLGIQRIEPCVAAYKQSIEEKLPFAQVQGKVLIRRIRWVEPPAPPPGKAIPK